MKLLVVYNPVAGGGREKLLQKFMAALVRRGAEVELYRTRFAGDATEHLQQCEQAYDCVIAVGGDGTTNEVINGIPPAVPLGVFATGTANVLAEELALPGNPELAAEVIMHGHTLTIWPSLLNGKRFCICVGLGYDAQVVHGADMSLKDKIGKGAYVLSMLKQVLHFGKQRYRLVIDGRPYDCFSAIFANSQHYGGSFTLSQLADITRQSIQVILLQRNSRLSLLKFMLALLVGRAESVSGVVSLAAKRVELVSPEGEVLQMDGDPAPPLPGVVEVDTTPLPVRVSSALARQQGL